MNISPELMTAIAGAGGAFLGALITNLLTFFNARAERKQQWRTYRYGFLTNAMKKLVFHRGEMQGLSILLGTDTYDRAAYENHMGKVIGILFSVQELHQHAIDLSGLDRTNGPSKKEGEILDGAMADLSRLIQQSLIGKTSLLPRIGKNKSQSAR